MKLHVCEGEKPGTNRKTKNKFYNYECYSYTCTFKKVQREDEQGVHVEKTAQKREDYVIL